MICLICRQAELSDGITTVNFEDGDMKFLIDNVPARVCPSCGEAYVSEEVAAQLLHIAEQMSEAGEFNAQCEYRNA